jgi:hypothetical protein
MPTEAPDSDQPPPEAFDDASDYALPEDETPTE